MCEGHECYTRSIRKGEGSVEGDQGCFVNLPYLLVRYIVVPVIDSICLCVYGCGCVCARVCVCVCVCRTNAEKVDSRRSV